MKRAGILLACFVVGSTVVFGFVFGLLAFIRGGATLPVPVEPFNLQFGFEMGLYGMFHWALLAMTTFPIFVLPLAALMGALRLWPTLLAHWKRSLPFIAGLAAFGVVARAMILERPTLFTNPTVFITSIVLTLNAVCELFAFGGGLLVSVAGLRALEP